MKIPHLYLLLVPTLLRYLGVLSNVVVMAANNGQMPVLYPGGDCPDQALSYLHSCMTSVTHLNFLADWMVINHVGIVSPGDLFLWTGTPLIVSGIIAWAALMIHEHNNAFHF